MTLAAVLFFFLAAYLANWIAGKWGPLAAQA